MLILVKGILSSLYCSCDFSMSLNCLEILNLKINKKGVNGRPWCLSVHVAVSRKSCWPASHTVLTPLSELRHCGWQSHQGLCEVGKNSPRIQWEEHVRMRWTCKNESQHICHDPLSVLSLIAPSLPGPLPLVSHPPRPSLPPQWHRTEAGSSQRVAPDLGLLGLLSPSIVLLWTPFFLVLLSLSSLMKKSSVCLCSSVTKGYTCAFTLSSQIHILFLTGSLSRQEKPLAGVSGIEEIRGGK